VAITDQVTNMTGRKGGHTLISADAATHKFSQKATSNDEILRLVAS